MKKSNVFLHNIDSIYYRNIEGYYLLEIKGWSSINKNYELYIDGIKQKAVFKIYERPDLVEIVGKSKAKQAGFTLSYHPICEVKKSLVIVSRELLRKNIILELTKEQLKQHEDIKSGDSCIDRITYLVDEGIYEISGWATCITHKPFKFLIHGNEEAISPKVEMIDRNDLVNVGITKEENKKCGFILTFEGNLYDRFNIELINGPYHRTYDSNEYYLYKKYSKGLDYNKWRLLHLTTKEELLEQKRTIFNYQPLISIVVATYNTSQRFLKEMIDSVINQTYSKWELCIADGSNQDDVYNYVLQHYDDHRIKIKKLSKNLGISGNMNEAIKMSTGDFIGFFDHDDLLSEDALYENVKVINKNNDLEFIYSDEDKTNEFTDTFFNPNFKPDFNKGLLLSNNYICHFLVVKKVLFDKIGYFNSDYDGAQDYDFVLRCMDILNKSQIFHISKVLYHWRTSSNSTASNPESKLYTFEAGKRALEQYYKRNSIEAIVEHGVSYGIYRTIYKVHERPLISIIIPNKDHIDDLKTCIESIKNHTSYKNYEIVIVENNSVEEQTFTYYHSLESHYDNLTVVHYPDKFNYSAINNFGVQYANGEYYLLLNNDVEVMNDDWLEELLGSCQQTDVGAVGAKLLYPDNTIQHAGVIIGIQGVAGHAFLNLQNNELGYFAYNQLQRDYSAVTAACMLVKAKAYKEVGGFNEDLTVCFNDVDFCLELGKRGYRINYNPYVELYHYESKSRGSEDTPEKIERFNKEVEYFQNKWHDFLLKGDPCYNRNLTIMVNDFSLIHADEVVISQKHIIKEICMKQA
ncbi:Glycosyltransferase, GT2 family [Sharpea azabuensis]|uniref:glycosyltransferase family 2 protein n=1 Tax=Sharpea azabuensis TaxID=322505 RepID=UPI0008E5790E|nr:glycosyltransferase family 2 protein [Sharpea azabuensis]SFD56438.1 Glycosyltransferase, GT2 family [Sharpea azabuensis]SFK56516.1 Glycosyltransferase, GT2 family [Sharpea azabuensis]